MLHIYIYIYYIYYSYTYYQIIWIDNNNKNNNTNNNNSWIYIYGNIRNNSREFNILIVYWSFFGLWMALDEDIIRIKVGRNSGTRNTNGKIWLSNSCQT